MLLPATRLSLWAWYMSEEANSRKVGVAFTPTKGPINTFPEACVFKLKVGVVVRVAVVNNEARSLTVVTVPPKAPVAEMLVNPEPVFT